MKIFLNKYDSFFIPLKRVNRNYSNCNKTRENYIKLYNDNINILNKFKNVLENESLKENKLVRYNRTPININIGFLFIISLLDSDKDEDTWLDQRTQTIIYGCLNNEYDGKIVINCCLLCKKRHSSIIFNNNNNLENCCSRDFLNKKNKYINYFDGKDYKIFRNEYISDPTIRFPILCNIYSILLNLKDYLYNHLMSNHEYNLYKDIVKLRNRYDKIIDGCEYLESMEDNLKIIDVDLENIESDFYMAYPLIELFHLVKKLCNSIKHQNKHLYYNYLDILIVLFSLFRNYKGLIIYNFGIIYSFLGNTNNEFKGVFIPTYTIEIDNDKDIMIPKDGPNKDILECFVVKDEHTLMINQFFIENYTIYLPSESLTLELLRAKIENFKVTGEF